jgi:hypothetical protein
MKISPNKVEFTAKECQAVKKSLSLTGNSAKKCMITYQLHYAISALPIPQVLTFRTGHLSTVEEECSGRSTHVTIPENVNAIHCMVLDNRMISAEKQQRPWRYPEKEQAILFTRFYTRKLSAKWVSKCLSAIGSAIECLPHKPFWTDSGVGFFNRLVTMEETWIHIYTYDPETKDHPRNADTVVPHVQKKSGHRDNQV